MAGFYHLGFELVKAANKGYNTLLTGYLVMQFFSHVELGPRLISALVFAVAKSMGCLVQNQLDRYSDITETSTLQATSILLTDVNIPAALCLMAL